MEGGSNDAAVCYDTGPGTPSLTFCLPSIPTGAYPINGPTLSTDDPPPCVPKVTPGGDYYVITAATITVNTMVRATGHRPLVLIARDSIQIDEGEGIDVGSHRMPSESIGAGAYPPNCEGGRKPMVDINSGGGAGGSFIGRGGPGGAGGLTQGSGSGSGGVSSDVMTVTAIQGGCAGQDGAGDHPGSGGHGGGAVFLIAGHDISVRGKILAGGAGGGGGVDTNSGGGGGGAGGMIGLDAPSINITGLLVANGGGGGEGAGNPNPCASNCMDGGDATTTAPARGGNGGTTNAGKGGSGSSGSAASSGEPADDGNSGSGGGGGGGGGGAGLIKVPASASLGGQVSPPPTP